MSLDFKRYTKKPIAIQAAEMKEDFSVETLEGTMKGKKGDYLLIGVRGETYPCRKDIFEETYERAPVKNNTSTTHKVAEITLTKKKFQREQAVVGEVFKCKTKGCTNTKKMAKGYCTQCYFKNKNQPPKNSKSNTFSTSATRNEPPKSHWQIKQERIKELVKEGMDEEKAKVQASNEYMESRGNKTWKYNKNAKINLGGVRIDEE